MRLRWAVTLLLELLLAHTVASSTGENGAGRVRSTVPISILNITEENEVASGHCGIIFPGTSAAQQLGQNKQRQACFALQSYGFLTRYMKHEQNEASSWGYDVCLLLAFCGSECHRLYGHPQKTAAATNALTEVEASITGTTASNRHDGKGTSPFPAEKPSNSGTSGGSATQSESQADGLQHSVTNHPQRGALAPDSPTTTLDLAGDSRFNSCCTKKHCSKCAKHFMSHAWRVSCKGVYSLEFEAQNQGFGRFLARLALLIGAADIEEVVDIERELQEYIRAKAMRALQGNASAPSQDASAPQESSGPYQPLEELARPSNEVSKNSAFSESQERATSSTYASYAAIGTSGLLDNELKIVLEPLPSNGAVVGSPDNAQLDKPAPTIQISIPSNFRARFAPVTAPSFSMAHTRRLRGTSARESANLETWVGHKPFPAGSTLSSARHCKAAAALMSQRRELQWLKEFTFFLPHRG